MEIGYLPILPSAQLFVALGQKDLLPAGEPAPKLLQFESGPALVQALLAGQLDAAYVGIGPALVARAKGADLRVVASDIEQQASVIALGPLAAYFASGDPHTAFARFAKDHGRKAVIASYPRGAVPETSLQHWLRETLHASADVQVIYQGESQIEQSLLTGAIDGAIELEPSVTATLARKPDARVVAQGDQLFAGMPGAVLVVRKAFIDTHPEVVQQMVRAHIAATQLLRDHPDQAAPTVQRYVGGGRLPLAVVQNAISKSHDSFIADPHAIEAGTTALQAYQTSLGDQQTPSVSTQDFFDTRFYDHATTH